MENFFTTDVKYLDFYKNVMAFVVIISL